MKKSLNELHAILKATEENVNKEIYNVLAISLKGKKIKKHLRCKFKSMDKEKAQVVTTNAFKHSMCKLI
jgi:hypothetical protein